MKKAYIIKSFVLILTIFLSSSCIDKNFLEEQPPHILVADNLYLDLNGFEAGLNTLYGDIRREFSHYNGGGGLAHLTNLIWMQGNDNVFASRWQSAPNYIVNIWGETNNSLEPYYFELWKWLYLQINAANTIINRAENPDINWMGSSAAQDETNKMRVIAKARLIRALMYRHLSFLWGDVPLNLEESDGAKINEDWQRTPLDEVRKSIESDLLFAEQYLPEFTNIPGDVAKPVAQHYLAELYLTTGENEKALAKASAVMNNNNYKLVTDRFGVNKNTPGNAFSDMFLENNSNIIDGNTEALWVWQYQFEVDGGDGRDGSRRWYGTDYASKLDGVSTAYTVDRGGRGMGAAPMTYWAIDLYEKDDDRGSNYILMRYIIVAENDNVGKSGHQVGDTLWFDYSESRELSSVRMLYWPGTRKFDYAQEQNVQIGEVLKDHIYLRLADTYLLYAEAQLKTGDKNGATNTINIIRNRSNATPVSSDVVNLDFILDERSRELVYEENRRYTLIRTNKWIERLKKYNPIAAETVSERDKLCPIPQVVIDANKNGMPQNPGY